MNYQNIIKDGQIIAKWHNETERMELAQLYLDIYRGVYKDIINDLIIDQLDIREASELIKYVESEGATERLIKDICLIYAEEPDIRIQKKVKKETVDDETFQEAFDELIESSNLSVVLDNINQLTKLLRDCPVLPQVRNGKVELDIITPEKCFVEQDPDNPKEAIKFYYQVGVLEDSPGRVNPINQYHYWDISSGKAKKYYCEISIDALGKFVINPDSVVELNAPVYDEMPVVMFRDYLPDDSFWYKGNSAIVDKAIAIDMRRTDLAMAEAYNIPQLVTKGMDTEHFNEIKRGRVFRINIPPNSQSELGDASFINPSEKLQELWELIKERYKSLALSKGLSESSISGSAATSGYHLALSKADILYANKRERKYYRQPTKKLLRIILLTAQEASLYNFPKDPIFSIDFGEIEFPQSDEEREKTWAMKFANGTANLIDYEMDHNPDLTREEAIEVIKQRKEEDKMFAPENPFKDKPGEEENQEEEQEEETKK